MNSKIRWNAVAALSATAVFLGTALGTAEAAPIPLPAGPVFFQFNNIEQVGDNNIVQPGAAVNPVTGATTPATTEGNWGVFNVSSIQRGAVSTPHIDISGGPAFFSDDGPGGSAGQVTGIFWGVNLTGPTTATGGFIDLWWHDAGKDTVTADDLNGTTFFPTNRTGANVDGTGKFTGGTFLGRLAFDSGIISGDPTTFISSNTDPTTVNVSGHADSFASVVDVNGDGKIDGLDGAWAGLINADYFFVDPNGNGTRGEAGETRDLRFSNFFNSLDPATSPTWFIPAAGINGLRSNDPGRTLVLPEPASLALLGAALLAAGAVGRRRRTR
jgi:hypothetical protein